MTTQTPEKWNVSTLGDSVDIIDGDRGNNYPKQSEFFDSGYCLFLNTKNVPSSSFSFNEKMFITKEKDSALRKGKLSRGDYVLTTRGTVGNFAYFSEKIPFENIRINSGMVILRLRKDGKLFPGYFKYYLDSPLFRGQIKSRSSGSAQPQLPIRDLAVFEIEIPELQTQQQIVNFLSAYDNLIENNTRRIQILEQLLVVTYNEWFISKEGGQNILRAGTLGDIATLIKKKYKEQKDRELPLIDMARIRSKSLSVSEFGTSSDLTTSRIIFNTGDILFGSIRTYLHKVALAPFPGITNTSVFVFRSINKSLFSFLVATLFREETIQWANQYSTGTKMPVIKSALFLTMPVLIPREEILEKFEENMKPVLMEVINLSVQNLKLKKIRDLLLPKLVGGEIRV